MNRWQQFAVALGLVAVLTAGCAYMVDTLHHVRIGMTREEAIQSVGSFPMTSFKQGPTEYLVYQVVASLFALYSETPNSVLFVHLENGIVVAKGVVGKREEARIKRIDPAFELRKFQKP